MTERKYGRATIQFILRNPIHFFPPRDMYLSPKDVQQNKQKTFGTSIPTQNEKIDSV